MPRSSASVLGSFAAVLVAPALTSCGLLGGGGGHLADALAVVPADARTVQFADHERAQDDAGLGGLETGKASDADLEAYGEALRSTPGLSTDLSLYFDVMQEAPFSDFDVVWAVSGFGEERGFAVYRLGDDVDLDEVGNELAAGGLAEDEVAGRRHFTFDPSTAPDDYSAIAGHYPLTFVDVTIDPDEHLLVAGDGATIMRVVDGELDALGETGSLDDLLGGTDDPVALQADLQVDCAEATSRIPPEAVAARQDEVAGLGTPSSWAYLATGDAGDDREQKVRLVFDDEDAAAADAAARSTFLSDGTLLTGQDVDVLGSFDVRQDGRAVDVGLDLTDAAAGLQFLRDGDGPIACPS